MNEQVSVVIWNTQWAVRASRRGDFFRRRFEESSSDVICVTEGYENILPYGGYVVMSEADYGYPLKEGRRKVFLWSRNPWRETNIIGSRLLPSGRFVASTTDTPKGAIRFIGVCIPWRDAHVRTGNCNRKLWEDHLTYLKNLAPLLKANRLMPIILLGDFNQRIPRARQPEHVYAALTATLASDFQLATAGNIAGAPGLSIDHLAVSSPLVPMQTGFLNHYDDNGAIMSDHFGLQVLLA